MYPPSSLPDHPSCVPWLRLVGEHLEADELERAQPRPPSATGANRLSSAHLSVERRQPAAGARTVPPLSVSTEPCVAPAADLLPIEQQEDTLFGQIVATALPARHALFRRRDQRALEQRSDRSIGRPADQLPTAPPHELGDVKRAVHGQQPHHHELRERQVPSVLRNRGVDVQRRSKQPLPPSLERDHRLGHPFSRAIAGDKCPRGFPPVTPGRTLSRANFEIHLFCNDLDSLKGGRTYWKIVGGKFNPTADQVFPDGGSSAVSAEGNPMNTEARTAARIRTNSTSPASWALALAFVATLAGCGGSSGGGSPDNPSGGPLGDGTDQNEDDPDLLPNVVVLDWVSDSDERDGYGFSVLVGNLGDAAVDVPDAWLELSLASDFSSGFAEHPVSLVPRPGADASSVLEPGEEAWFDGRDSGRESFELPLFVSRTIYARLRLNPDLAVAFRDPGNVRTSTREITELDYTDNVSEVASIRSGGRPCVPDAYEDNDTIESAAPILTDTVYEIGNCDDSLDIFAVELAAGDAYELVDHEAEGESSGFSSMRVHLLDPNGRYLMRDRSFEGVVRAEIGGMHHIVVHSTRLLDHVDAFELRTQPE